MYIILIEVFIMPVIRPSSDLRNNYNEISTICHQTNRPVYITKKWCRRFSCNEFQRKLIEAMQNLIY